MQKYFPLGSRHIYMYNMLINNMMTNMNWLIESESKLLCELTWKFRKGNPDNTSK